MSKPHTVHQSLGTGFEYSSTGGLTPYIFESQKELDFKE